MIGTASVQIACDAFVCENCVAEYENSDFILYFFLLAFVQACNAIERGWRDWTNSYKSQTKSA